MRDHLGLIKEAGLQCLPFFDETDRVVDFWGEFRALSRKRQFENQGNGPWSALGLTNPVCGDEVSIQVSLVGGRLERFEYRARGCWPTLGSLELLGELWLGQEVQQCLELRFEEFLNQVSNVPASKRHAFALVFRASFQALVAAHAAQASELDFQRGPNGKERV